MNDLEAAHEVPFIVAGFVRLFPTVYPEEAPFMVGNLDYAFEQQGGQYPYEVWLRLQRWYDRARWSGRARPIWG